MVIMSLQLENANYTINQKSLLKNVSITSAPGRLTTIIGANGAGKSTALKLMSGDLLPTEGSISINQKNINAYNAGELARLRAVLPQQTFPAFQLKVWELVQLGRAPFGDSETQRMDFVHEALSTVDAIHLADRDLLTLSGGEKQRVLLAKALAQVFVQKHDEAKQKYLLLDEPTASLDLKQSHVVMEILRKTADSGIGVLLVIHDLAAVKRYGDIVFILKNGRLTHSGDPKEILTFETIAKSYDIDSETARASFSLN
tara:strand:- start:432 stop:1205 length:774 start_codon:yes stop_codon:yes gene_type:complete